MYLSRYQQLVLCASLVVSPCKAYVDWLYPPISSNNLNFNYNDLVYFTWESNFTDPLLRLWCASDNAYQMRTSPLSPLSPPLLISPHRKNKVPHHTSPKTDNSQQEQQSSQLPSPAPAPRPSPSPTAPPSTKHATCPCTAATTPPAVTSARAPNLASHTIRPLPRRRGALLLRHRWARRRPVRRGQ